MTEETYPVLGLFIPMGEIQKPTLQSYFSTKMFPSIPDFGDIVRHCLE
jgi:hypothetical protein